ncbi:MAG: DUF3576 domain-containing protein [Alphaproteobacteria bacterium]|jgi:hypothetical protein|nr:DUF3576 domain-containing protein [Alphaproteobacteria bacterium]MDP6517483.1 DUF3576 domain-containing protein [Alphaproteobacteria bacterium]
MLLANLMRRAWSGWLSIGLAGALVVAALGLSGCDKIDFGTDPTYPKPRPQPASTGEGTASRGDSSGIGDLFGSETAPVGVGVGVNSFLWRASLDTLSFLPLSSADPFGGVIITDWYAPPDTPDERFKVTAYILDRDLRSDGIRIAVFRQVQQAPGQWTDAPVNETMAADIENSILTRARQLKIRTNPG